MNIPSGAVLYVDRGLNKHFGIHIGNGQVVHFSDTDPNSKRKEKAIIHKVCLAEFLGESREDIKQLVNGDKDKDFAIYTFKNISHYNKNIEDCKILKKDYKNAPFDINTIVNRAVSSIGCNYYNSEKDKYEKRLFGYDLLDNNCEHFAMWCITGKASSEQTKTVSNFLSLLKDFYNYYPTSYKQISDWGKGRLLLNTDSIKQVENKVKISKDSSLNKNDKDNTIASKSTFVSNKKGENSFATCKIGLKVGERVKIDATERLSGIIRFNDEGCVHSIRVIKKSYNCCSYRIEVEAEGPHAGILNRCYIRFYNRDGYTCILSINDSSRKVHYLGWDKDPDIIKIVWSNNRIPE